MGLSYLFGGVMAPVLLMLSPLAVAVARECADWHPVAKAVGDKDAARPCGRPPLMLM